MSYKSMKKGT